VTTQLGTRHSVHPLSWRYRTDVVEFLSKRRLNCKVYSDTLFSKVKLLKQNTCAQVFVTENFVQVHPMRTKAEDVEALREFTKGLTCWYTSAEDYLKGVLVNLDNTLRKEGLTLATGRSTDRP